MSTVYLDAVLEPPRSLSPRGFDRVMLGVGLASAVGGVIWLLASGGEEAQPRVEAPVQLHLTGRGAAVRVRW